MFQVRALQCQGILSFHSPELHFGGQRLVGDPAVWILIRERHGNSKWRDETEVLELQLPAVEDLQVRDFLPSWHILGKETTHS